MGGQRPSQRRSFGRAPYSAWGVPPRDVSHGQKAEVGRPEWFTYDRPAPTEFRALDSAEKRMDRDRSQDDD